MTYGVRESSCRWTSTSTRSSTARIATTSTGRWWSATWESCHTPDSPTIPPFLVVEILSLEDRVVRLQPKIREYLTQHPDLNIQLADLLSALD